MLEASARLTAKGYTQEEGRDYDETHMPPMSISSFYMQEATSLHLKYLHMKGCISMKGFIDKIWDITGAYYTSKPSHVQYMDMPEGHSVEGMC